ncbi:basic proline-rich protein-like [Dipodomys spectabilis]|uniref:basic proline-rich protein-like n=1 Tax=Dipodomys spectabilis TaxID=105255 RepID=UPI001C5373D5|nr:basic proline-rich protein-like [Dipodomys spectabilis]
MLVQGDGGPDRDAAPAGFCKGKPGAGPGAQPLDSARAPLPPRPAAPQPAPRFSASGPAGLPPRAGPIGPTRASGSPGPQQRPEPPGIGTPRAAVGSARAPHRGASLRAPEEALPSTPGVSPGPGLGRGAGVCLREGGSLGCEQGAGTSASCRRRRRQWSPSGRHRLLSAPPPPAPAPRPPIGSARPEPPPGPRAAADPPLRFVFPSLAGPRLCLPPTPAPRSPRTPRSPPPRDNRRRGAPGDVSGFKGPCPPPHAVEAPQQERSGWREPGGRPEGPQDRLKPPFCHPAA